MSLAITGQHDKAEWPPCLVIGSPSAALPH